MNHSPYMCNSFRYCCPVESCHLWQTWVVGFQPSSEHELGQLCGQTAWRAVPRVTSFAQQNAPHHPLPFQITNDDLCRKSPCREHREAIFNNSSYGRSGSTVIQIFFAIFLLLFNENTLHSYWPLLSLTAQLLLGSLLLYKTGNSNSLTSRII